MDGGSVYDEIAESWYNFRHWTRFRRELEKMRDRWRGGRLLNVGCAHGPDFLPFRQGFDLWGMDFSLKMLGFALRYSLKFQFGAKLVLADARWLPYPDEAFDWAISVAAYHNIEGREGRTAALAELHRVLKPGGEAFITVWNRWQPRFWLKGKEVLVPWRTRKGTVQRYYYLFSRGELSEALRKTGFRVVRLFPERSYRFPARLFSRNICVLARKV